MADNAFFEAYKHPLWQEMRLRVMERDCFICRECQSNEKTLNVHHNYYLKGKKPWEYDPDSLLTLCEDCHKRRHAITRILQIAMVRLGENELRQLVGYATGIYQVFQGDDGDASRVQKEYWETLGLADAWGCPQFHRDIFEAVDSDSITPQTVHQVTQGNHR